MMILILSAAAAMQPLSAADRTAIYNAAGFAGGRGCEGRPVEIEARDINGDGKLDAIVTDNGISCYGGDETGFALLTRAAPGTWTLLHQSPGIPTFLAAQANGWPELEVGGQGFCFPVLRWNGKEFANARMQYEGKPCRPQR